MTERVAARVVVASKVGAVEVRRAAKAVQVVGSRVVAEVVAASKEVAAVEVKVVRRGARVVRAGDNKVVGARGAEAASREAASRVAVNRVDREVVRGKIQD